MSYIYESNRAEPHRIRRIQLLKRYPQLRALYGYSYWTSVVIFFIVFAQLLIAKWVQAHYDPQNYLKSLPYFILISYFCGGSLNHWAGMGIHESSHNLVAKTEIENKIIALIANIPIVVPSAMSFRRYHLKHHTHLGILGEDNDLATEFEIRWVGRSKFRKTVWLLFYVFFGTLARGFIRKLSEWEIINVIFIVISNFLIVKYIGWIGLLYLGVSTFLGYGLHPAAAHFIHEHYIWKEGQETYSYYGPLNWITFNVGYHNEHHDLMWIPGWRLPKVREIAPEFYNSLVSHRSWVWVLFRFVTQTFIGHDSRIIRSKITMKRGVA